MASTTRSRPRAVRPVDADDVEVELLPAPVEFTVRFERDGEEEPHVFAARPRFTYKRMADVAKAQRRNSNADAIMIFERMIRPALCDDDGTPAKWMPDIEDGEFVDPDGNPRPTKDLPAVQDFDAGSSRRRWLYLMDQDDELEVEIDEITKAYELLVEAASDRPTRKSSR